MTSPQRNAAILAAINKHGWTGTPPEIRAAGMATTVVHERVPRGVLVNEITNMEHASGVPVWELVMANVAIPRDDPDPAKVPVGIACRQAKQLRDDHPDLPPINLLSPTFQGALTVFVGADILTQAQADLLTGLGDRTITLWEAEGVSVPTEREIVVAMGG